MKKILAVNPQGLTYFVSPAQGRALHRHARSMKFIPFDIATFLVPSRTRRGITHVLSFTDPVGCSCEAYENTSPFNTCAHYREAIKRRKRGKLSVIVAMRGKA